MIGRQHRRLDEEWVAWVAKSFLIYLLLSVSAEVLGQSCPDNSLNSIAWEKLVWRDGSRINSYRLPLPQSDDSVAISFRIMALDAGYFKSNELITPYVDEGEDQHFGLSNDIGLMYTGREGQGPQKVLVKAYFSKPLSCVSFEISDIDISGHHWDEVVVYGNDSTILPELKVVGTDPVVTTFKNQAKAIVR